MPEIHVRGFLFDMDGTLLNSAAVVEKLWREVSERFLLDADEVITFSHGRQAYAVLAHYLPDEPTRTHDEIVAWMDGEELVLTEGIFAIPGARALLESLEAHGAPVALVTSAGLPLARTRLAAAEVPMPARTVTAEHVAHSKPHPEGFLRGAELLGLDAADCVVFEDADAGMQAAIAAGATLVGVGTTPTMTDAGEHAVARLVDYTGVTVRPGADDTWVLTIPEPPIG